MASKIELTDLVRPRSLKTLTPGETVELQGMVFNTRVTKWGGFILLRKPEGVIQAVIQNDVTAITDEKGETITLNALSRESAIAVKGVVNASNIKDPASANNQIEISAEAVRVISAPSTTELIDQNSIQFDPDTSLAFKLDHRQVTLRNPRDMAIFRVNAVIVKAFAEFLTANGFTQIFSPKIVAEGAEGGANVFSMDYFGKNVYLAQSPQFYKQIGVGVFERVFEIAPAYRAERHNTSRHLNEYISLDVEMGFIKGQEDVMLLESCLLEHIIRTVESECAHELAFLKATLPKMPHTIPVFRLSETHEILMQHYADKMSMDHRGEPDLAPEEEVLICDYALKEFDSDFVFITHFPSSHRAFYAMDDPEDPTLTLSYDLLMRGREITSGGQRIHREEEYVEKMLRRGMHPENFKFYLETFRNGMPPHGGFAIGLERILSGFLGIPNIKEVSLFPRDINRVAP